MYHPDQTRIDFTPHDGPASTPTRSACLVPGCPCKDARIVSRRRAAFFAAMARRTGETADRIVAADSDWAFARLGGAVSAVFAVDPSAVRA